MAKSTTPTCVVFPRGELYAYDSIWLESIERGECKALYGKEGKAALHEHRRQALLKLIPVKSTLTTVCTYSKQSGNGITAKFKVFIPAVSPEGRTYIRNITKDVADLAGFTLTKDQDIIMGGMGYSKSFQIGYSLGLTLWPNGTPEPHGTRNGEPDSNGGYAISVQGF